MGRYNFQSTGGNAGNAIQAFLMQREQENQAQMRQRFLEEQQAEELRQREEQIQLQRQQEERIGKDSEANRNALENQRQFGRATTIAENALPDDAVDDATRKLLEAQGFGGQVKRTPGIVVQGPQIDEQDGVPIYDVNAQPDSYKMRGGSKYLSARAAEDARAAQAKETEAGRNERADSDREMRLLIAQMSASSNAGQRALADELKRVQIDRERGKLEDDQTKRDDVAEKATLAKTNAQRTSQDTIDVIKQLADIDEQGNLTLKPGTANLFGAQNPLARMVPGSDTNTAKGALGRLRSRVLIDLLNEMKNQSRTGATGFGSMNPQEFGALESGASQLGSPMISDESALAELKRIYDVAKRAHDGAATPATGGGGAAGPVEYDYVNGKLVPRVKP